MEMDMKTKKSVKLDPQDITRIRKLAEKINKSEHWTLSMIVKDWLCLDAEKRRQNGVDIFFSKAVRKMLTSIRELNKLT